MIKNSPSKRGFLKLLLSAGVLASGLSVCTPSHAAQGLGDRIRRGFFMEGAPTRNPDYSVRREGSDIVLYRIASSENILKLNETAFQIWNLCDGTVRMNEIASALSEKFDVPVPTCKRDLYHAVSVFRHYGVVTI